MDFTATRTLKEMVQQALFAFTVAVGFRSTPLTKDIVIQDLLRVTSASLLSFLCCEQRFGSLVAIFGIYMLPVIARDKWCEVVDCGRWAPGNGCESSNPQYD
jgi:hypothetical protein